MTETAEQKAAASTGVSDSMALLAATDSKVLARWWCQLNRFEWPIQLWEPESKNAPLPNRRGAIMGNIMKIIGHKECLREWNRDSMSGDAFDNWYATTFRS